VAEKDYRQEAEEDAKNAIEDYLDEIVEQLVDGESAEDDLEYYNQDRSHYDQSFSLRQAADVLDDLSRYEETDRGLWDSLETPEEMVQVKASFTYGNAVAAMFSDEMKTVNSDLSDVLEALGDDQSLLHSTLRSLEERGAPLNEIQEAEEELKAFEKSKKFRVQREVLKAIGRFKGPEHPKDWVPGVRE